MSDFYICRTCSQRVHGLVELGAGTCSFCVTAFSIYRQAAIDAGVITPQNVVQPTDDTSTRLLESVFGEGDSIVGAD